MHTDNQIHIKTTEEIRIMREAGKILAEVLKKLRGDIVAGTTTQDIDIIAENLIRDQHVLPAFKGYRGFPGCVCISVNEEIVHGIPGDRVIQDGDLVSIDCGIVYKDFYSDSAMTVGVGQVSSEFRRLMDVTRQSLYQGIEKARVGNRLSDISHAVQKYAESKRLAVVREFVGHGIGKSLHEDPEIPNFGIPHQGPELKEGMVFAIEPMVNIGTWKTKICDDGWTVVTQDGRCSAHFEHTIAITKGDPEILTEQDG